MGLIVAICDSSLSVYVITSADACNGGAASVPAIVPQPSSAVVSDASPIPVASIVGGVVGGIAALSVILAVVFRRRIIQAFKRCRGQRELDAEKL